MAIHFSHFLVLQCVTVCGESPTGTGIPDNARSATIQTEANMNAILETYLGRSCTSYSYSGAGFAPGWREDGEGGIECVISNIEVHPSEPDPNYSNVCCCTDSDPSVVNGLTNNVFCAYAQECYLWSYLDSTCKSTGGICEWDGTNWQKIKKKRVKSLNKRINRAKKQKQKRKLRQKRKFIQQEFGRCDQLTAPKCKSATSPRCPLMCYPACLARDGCVWVDGERGGPNGSSGGCQDAA